MLRRPILTPTAEKLATGILTDEQFQQLNGRYLAEQETLKEHTAHLETELAKQQDELDNVGNFLAVVDRHLEVPGLMLEILREFVHHITEGISKDMPSATSQLDILITPGLFCLWWFFARAS